MAEIDRAAVVQSDDSKKMRTLQVVVLADETRDDIEHFEPYGFTSRIKPPADKKGAEAIVATLGNTSDLGVAIVVADRRYRVTGLEEGEVCLHDDQGQSVKLARGRIEVIAKPGNTVDVTGPAGINLNGNTVVDGTVQAKDGYKAGDASVQTGVTGTLTIVDGMTGSTATLTLAGGIVTSVAVTGTMEWTPDVLR